MSADGFRAAGCGVSTFEPESIRALIFDLDGTVYRGRDAIPGAADFVEWISRSGRRVLFVTNRANRLPETVRDQLLGLGVSCAAGQVVTSAGAAARALAGARVWYIGESGVAEALEAESVEIDRHAPDAVLVSYDRQVNLDKIGHAAKLIRAGARFVATNTDSTITTERGHEPEAGPIVAAVANASGAVPDVMGKPNRRIIEHALRVLGAQAGETLLVGDNLHTDILAAANAATRSALILTGVSSRGDLERAPARPDWVVDDYAELARRFA